MTFQVKSHSLKLYEKWLTSASHQQIEFVDAIYAECEKHYNDGGDIIVEAFTPQEILVNFKSINDARSYCGLKIEQTLNNRWGENNDHELKRMKNFENWK